MANFDYPGPCPSCSAIDGCATDAARASAVSSYCKGLEMELNAWKARLYDVLVDADAFKGADRDALVDSLNLVKSTVREIEGLIASMENECPSSLAGAESQMGGKLNDIRVHYTKALSVLGAGSFGG